jgi:hypothetical protein
MDAIRVVGETRHARGRHDDPTGGERGVALHLDGEAERLADDGVVVGDAGDADDVAGADDRVVRHRHQVLRTELDPVDRERLADRRRARRSKRQQTPGVDERERDARRRQAQDSRSRRGDVTRKRP